MKVYVDTIVFDLQKAGGISVYWYEIINRLKRDTDVDLVLVDSGAQKNNIFFERLDLSGIKIIKQNKFFNRYRAVNYPENEKHIFMSSYYRYSKNKNATNMTVVHDFTYEYYVKGLKKLVHTHQKYKAIAKSEFIICISHNTLRDLHTYAKPKGKEISVVYNGASGEYRRLGEDELAQRISVLSEALQKLMQQKFVMFVGARAGYKNWDKAIDLFKGFPPEYVFATVGGGALTEEEQAKVSALDARHIYVPPVTEQTLALFYNKAQCLMYLSDYEGFGIPVVEAQNCGCPVLAQNKSSIPEVAGNGTYLLDLKCQPNIQELLEFISKDFQYQLDFSWDKCYNEIIRCFK